MRVCPGVWERHIDGLLQLHPTSNTLSVGALGDVVQSLKFTFLDSFLENGFLAKSGGGVVR